MTSDRAYRVAIYSPDRVRYYDGRTRERDGIGGGVTARLSMAEALASLGHEVTAYVHCEEPVAHRGVSYVPIDGTTSIDCDVFVAISTAGSPSFAPVRDLQINAGLKLIWVQGAPAIEDLEAVDADYVYTASNFLRMVCSEDWGVPRWQTFVCYNGIHPEYFAGEGPARDPHAIAYVGPPEKGLEACVQVLRRLRKHDARFHLDVFGGAELWGQTTPAFNEPGLQFMGLLGQPRLAAALRGYEYCLALQTMAEGFGIAVQEAKRAGTIVLASAVGALPELIRHGADGYLIHERHSSSAAQNRAAALIVALADDPLRRARIRRRGEATPWNWHLAAQSWAAHWSHVLPASPRQSVPETIDLPDGRHRTSDGAYAPGIDVYPLSPVSERLGLAPVRHVTIGGYYGHGNLGDEAVLSVLISQLQTVLPETLTIVLSGDPKATQAAHDVIAVDEQDITAVSDAVRQSDLVVLGGGGLLHDYHGVDENTLLRRGHWGLTQCAALPVLAAKHNRPFAIISVGAGPLSSEAGQRYVRAIASQARALTVRDEGSKTALEAAGISRDRIEITADPAFLLQSAPPESAQRLLSSLGLKGAVPILAVAMRDWNLDDGARQRDLEIAHALDALVERERASILFVPFDANRGNVHEDDVAVGHRIHKLMRSSGRVVHAPARLTPAVTQSLFAAADLVIAMRLHAVILASNAGVPAVAIRYDHKVTDIVRSLGLDEYALDLGSVSSQALVDRAAAALQDRQRIRETLGKRLPGIRSAAASAVTRILEQVHAGASQPMPSTPEWASIAERATAALASTRATGRSADDTVARRLARTVLPAPLRRTLREAVTGRLLTPAAAVFDRYKRARDAAYGSDLRGLGAPGEQGLVTIVLPAWNGATMIREAIDSVLAQTHQKLELVIVNDGSTDETGAIADDYARKDSRVRVLHQDNQKLPAALSRGFANANGEFLTWTSCDNRWKPDGIERLVSFLHRHSNVDLAYGNLDLIGEDGQPLRRSPHYISYQHPHGSEHIRLPDSTLELNVRANNFIGAGFMYRRRVAMLLGDYDRSRFVLEDYDYWMRVNALMTVQHVDFAESVVDYRFHRQSLTARWQELGMFEAREKLMDFDSVRRDRYIGPMVWHLDASPDLTRSLTARLQRAGHVVARSLVPESDIPAAWLPRVFVREVGDSSESVQLPPGLPAGVTKVVVATGNIPRIESGDGWDLTVALPGPGLQRSEGPGLQEANWLVARDVDTLFRTVDIKAKTTQVNAIEASPATPPRKVASVTICTNRDVAGLSATLEAAMSQDFPSYDYEVIVVDNAAGDASTFEALLRRWPDRLRIVSAVIPGLSAARNAGIGAARGEFVCFLDDDAVPAPGWLTAVCAAFREHPKAAVIGGPLLLQTPSPQPSAFNAGWQTYFGHFPVDGTGYREAASWREYPWGANWAARRSALVEIGGFPMSFGRRPGDFGGGEEHIAAARLARRGYRIGIAAGAVVYHHVAAERFTEHHVKETMISRQLTAWRAAQELGLTGHSAILRTAARVALHHIDPRVKPLRAMWKDFVFRKHAQLRLLNAQWNDLRESFR